MHRAGACRALPALSPAEPPGARSRLQEPALRCHKEPSPPGATAGAPSALPLPPELRLLPGSTESPAWGRQEARGRLWERRARLLLGGALLGRGPALTDAPHSRECPPAGDSRLGGAIPGLQLGPSEHLAVPWLVFHRWDVGLKHPHLGAGGVSPSPQDHSATAQQRRRRGGEATSDPHKHPAAGTGTSSPRLTQWQRAQGPAGLPMDTMECSAGALCTPTVIGTPRSSQGSVLSCR